MKVNEIFLNKHKKSKSKKISINEEDLRKIIREEIKSYLTKLLNEII